MLDCTELGSALPLRSFSWLGFGVPVLSFLHVGMLLFPRQSACLGLAFPACGCTKLGFALLVLDLVDLGSAILSRSLACLSSAPSAHNLASLELPLLLHGASCTGFLLTVFSQGILDMLSLALDLAFMGALVTARSCAHPGATALAMAFLQPDALLFLQGTYCLESFFSVLGCSRSGPCMLASDSLQLDVSLLLRRIAHAGLVLSVLSSMSSGVFLFLRGFVRPEMTSSMIGVT